MNDTISRQAAIEAFNTNLDELVVGGEKNAKTVENYLNRVLDKIKRLPPAEPKRETATVSVGKSKAGVTMWYECAACGEPVDPGDTFCSGCGRELIHE